MNWDTIEGKWAQLQGAVREKWGEISHDELEKLKGNREHLIGVIQERYGKTRAAVEKEVDEWMSKLKF